MTLLVIVVFLIVNSYGAQAADDYWPEILIEATERSDVMDTLLELSDVRGPRLTGTQNFFAAAEWSRDQLRRWGVNARLVPLRDHYRGWYAERVSVSMLDPRGGPLRALPVPWSGATGGVIFGTPLAVDFSELTDLMRQESMTANSMAALCY